jgi:rRNA maturation RNase YbeY
MIIVEPHPDFAKTGLLEDSARAVLEHESVDSNVSLSIVLTDDSKLRELNREYLGIDAPTDVLSFPASETDPETGVRYLGDILISIPRALEQAGAAGHGLEGEVQLLVIHGVLHLLGHDHAGAEEKARMWAAQAEVLERLGLSHVQVREEYPTSLRTFVTSRISSFGHALRGWSYVMRTQQNAWIHATVSMIVFALCLWVGIPPRDWAVIILTVAMVFSAEFVNTAIEAVVDLASPVHHPLAKVGKDVGAAAVLVAASAAFLIGLLIIGPPLWTKLSQLFLK